MLFEGGGSEVSADDVAAIVYLVDQFELCRNVEADQTSCVEAPTY